MTNLKHLPIAEWPPADRLAFDAAFRAGDIFEDNGGPGAHLKPGSRLSIVGAYRRWLGFLAAEHPTLLKQSPGERLTPDTVRSFIGYLSGQVAFNTVAITVDHVYAASRLIAPNDDWTWLRSLKSRLNAQTRPADRFDRLTAPWKVLDHAIELMDAAAAVVGSPRHFAEIQFRNGLLLALLAVWPIRRRSIGALTATRHVERQDGRLQLLLYPEDTKSGRAENFAVPPALASYVLRYLDHVRPQILGMKRTDAFWVSSRGTAMCEQQLYEAVRRLTHAAFGKAMGLHDFRRAAATFLAMEAPELIGLIPGVLQHTTPDVSERHYNLARSTTASRRHIALVADVRARLRGAWRRQQQGR